MVTSLRSFVLICKPVEVVALQIDSQSLLPALQLLFQVICKTNIFLETLAADIHK